MINYKAQMTKGNGFGIQAFGFQRSYGFWYLEFTLRNADENEKYKTNQ
jgi:hypothetical protein